MLRNYGFPITRIVEQATMAHACERSATFDLCRYFPRKQTCEMMPYQTVLSEITRVFNVSTNIPLFISHFIPRKLSY